MLRKPIRSEEERRIVRGIAKKKKNVYFNKKSPSGTPKYLNGKFYSKKNEQEFEYKSSYELAFFHQLESNEEVLNYMYEPFEVPYIDFYKKSRNYRPDLLILYADGSVVVAEIKPTAMLADYDVQAKAKAARHYIQLHYKDIKIEYKFITEKCIFKNNTEYVNFLNEMKKQIF
jgi:hypothetical protein